MKLGRYPMDMDASIKEKQEMDMVWPVAIAFDPSWGRIAKSNKVNFQRVHKSKNNYKATQVVWIGGIPTDLWNFLPGGSGSYGGSSGGSYGSDRPAYNTQDLGKNLQKINWNHVSLVKFEKDAQQHRLVGFLIDLFGTALVRMAIIEIMKEFNLILEGMLTIMFPFQYFLVGERRGSQDT